MPARFARAAFQEISAQQLKESGALICGAQQITRPGQWALQPTDHRRRISIEKLPTVNVPEMSIDQAFAELSKRCWPGQRETLGKIDANLPQLLENLITLGRLRYGLHSHQFANVMNRLHHGITYWIRDDAAYK